jgi:RHH-type rel operon transcriptional repressor/antitoxin RelB
MELILAPELHARLNRLAAKSGRDEQTLAREAIERFVDYDEWFIAEVEKGLAQIEQGQVLTHEEVGARVEKLIAEKHSRF